MNLNHGGSEFDREGGTDIIHLKVVLQAFPRTHVIRGHGEPIVQALIRQIRRRPDIFSP